MKKFNVRMVHKILTSFKNMHGDIAVAYGNDIFYHDCFSYADALWKISKNAQYLMGSVTKQFTAVALLKSFYDGQIKLGGDSKKIKMLVKNDLP